MSNKGLLYTIRNFYENRGKTGIILTLSAQDNNGDWQTVRAYVPYNSRYTDSATACMITDLGGTGERGVRVEVPKERRFEADEEI